MNNGVRGYDPSTDLAAYFAENDIRVVKVTVPDMEGMLRGKRIMSQFFLESVAHHGSHFADLIFGWDVLSEPITGLKYTGAHTGYPDLTLVPDLSTLHMVPGEPGVAMVLCDAYSPEGEVIELAPREILRRVIAKANEMGYDPVCAYEFEFYLFERGPRELSREGFHELVPVTDGIFPYSVFRDSGSEWVIGDIRDRLAAIGVFIEASNSEYGPGQFEVNIHYSDALSAADSAVLLKNTVKEVAAEHGLTATFMAKVKSGDSGNSGHVHQSLVSRETGEAVFANPTNPEALSEIGMHYLAGVLHHAKELATVYLPTPNSFKRVLANDFTGGSTTWSVDNRTVAVRAIPSSGPAARVENRIAGADANPYLVLAATVAAGLEGIAQKMDAGPETKGSTYEMVVDPSKALPGSVEQAAALFRQSAVAKKYLGAEFVEHFARMREWEAEKASLAVTDWEVQRYIERI